MTKRYIKYTLSTLLALGLGSCASEDFWYTFDRTADGPINFTVGVEASPSPVQRAMTRAGGATPSYYAMKAGTQVRLKVDGKWIGKSSEDISKNATCKTDAPTSTANTLTYETGQTLYWDDFGAGDPANATNTTNGLKILGVAVDGEATAPVPEEGKWDALAWSTVDKDGKAEVNSTTHLLTKDVLVSNNLTGSNTYKFDSRNNESAGLLNFKHVLSKITINLTASEGFPTTGGVGKTTNRFASDPVLTLTNAATVEAASNTSSAYALTEGTINIESAEAKADDAKTKKNVIAATTNDQGTNVTIVKEALVYPGTLLGANSDADKKVIAQLNADGNIYYIKAKEISEAMYKDDSSTDYTTKAGKNYIINIIVNKTDIHVSATVSSWDDVTAQQVDPKINIGEIYGANSNAAFDKGFSLYRSSTGLNTGYGEQSAISKNNSSWEMNPQLYWPDHKTHFQFRGVWPETTTDANVTTSPRIETATHNSEKYQVIKISNVEYKTGTFPSDLMIARPEIDPNAECTNTETGHTKTKLYDGGICATEGNINLNFRYMMAKVEVNLSTTDTDNSVDLSGAVVDIVNIYNTGDVKLGDRGVFTTGTLDNYTLNTVSGTENSNKRLSAIVPQTLTYSTPGADSNVRFRITLNNGDVYYADVNPIKKTSSTELVAPDGAWKAGVYYVYNLKLTKTAVSITASLSDWEKVDANETVWF
jgi:hypothetical protein